MTHLAPVMALGLILGMRHATDADHVIAVTTIVARQRTARAAAAIGAAWGVGHTLTILLVGTGIIAFGWVIPPRVGLSTELTVGVMLIILGGVNLSSAVRDIRGIAARAPEEKPLARLDRRFGSYGGYQLLRPLVVGIVHGLAGSAAVALLVLTTIQTSSWAILYLLVFGLGTIIGMMLMTSAIVLPFARSENRFAHVSGGLRVATSVLSVAFGLWIAYRIGFVHGLFTGDPHWTPS